MLLTVNEFCTRVRRDMPALVDQLQDETGRSTPEEEMAWSRSLPEVAGILDHEGLQDLHVHLRDRSALSLEYRLPAASGWCDLVLLGRGDETPAAVLFELKNWDISATKPGPRESIVLHHSDRYPTTEPPLMRFGRSFPMRPFLCFPSFPHFAPTFAPQILRTLRVTRSTLIRQGVATTLVIARKPLVSSLARDAKRSSRL